MRPRGPLMVEHRLIEKMIALVREQLPLIQERDQVDPVLLDTVVDFVRTYADRTHHGKEEEILFRDLATKAMSPRDQRVMQELIEEHRYGRSVVAKLVQAKQDYLQGQQDALPRIVEQLRALVAFYPKHIEKEDKDFFPNSERYLSEPEQQAMLQGFWEFDRQMIHEKYKAVVASLREQLQQ